VTNPCVHCNENESDFDTYLCKKCAEDFQVTPQTTRDFYGFLARTGRSYLTSYLSRPDQEQGKPHDYIFAAPAASFHHARRFNFFTRMAELVRGVPGDIVECGVEHGQTLLYWLSIAFDELTPRNVWGFDSFAGPETVGEKDKNSNGDIYPPLPNVYARATEGFINLLNAYGLPRIWTNSHLVVIPGFFSETLKDYRGEKIAILHLDANYYDSYKTCMEMLWPKVARGGVVIFDEYQNQNDTLHFAGAKRAIDEYMETLKDDGTTITRDKMYGKFYCIKGGIQWRI